MIRLGFVEIPFVRIVAETVYCICWFIGTFVNEVVEQEIVAITGIKPAQQ